MKILAVLLLLSATTFAAKHAPLPDGLLNAKTVYIVNKTGDQKVMDGAYEEVAKWGHYSIAKSKDSADIVMIFTNADELYQGTSVPQIELSVYLPTSGDPAYEDTVRRHFNSMAGVAKGCIKDFRKRVEQK